MSVFEEELLAELVRLRMAIQSLPARFLHQAKCDEADYYIAECSLDSDSDEGMPESDLLDCETSIRIISGVNSEIDRIAGMAGRSE